MRVDIVADRLAETGAQPVFVRPARARRNAIDVASDVLVGRLGPLQHQVEPRLTLASLDERDVVNRFCAALLDNLLQVVRQALLVVKDLPGPVGLVLERDADALVDVAGNLEALTNRRRIELHLRKDRRVGMEEHGCAAAACGTRFLQKGPSASRA